MSHGARCNGSNGSGPETVDDRADGVRQGQERGKGFDNIIAGFVEVFRELCSLSHK